MSREIIASFTLLAFIVFSISCFTTRLKEVRTVADWQGAKVKILALNKTSGEYVEFSKKRPGRIYGDKIAGTAVVSGTAVVLSKKVEITQDNIKGITRDHKGMISEILNKKGKIYHVVNGTARVVSTKDDLTGKKEKRIIFIATYNTYESVTIPLSEVKSVKVKNLLYVESLFVFGVIGLGFRACKAALSTEVVN